jgi:hypothetical protein
MEKRGKAGGGGSRDGCATLLFFYGVQECYIVRQIQTLRLPWPKNTVKCRKIAGGGLLKNGICLF